MSKKIFLLLVWIAVLTEAFAQTVEQAVYECLKDHYQENGVHLETELDSLEEHIIIRGYLKSSHGKAYYEFYEELIENEELEIKIDTEKFRPLLQYASFNFASSMKCHESLVVLDPEKIATSKFYQIQLSFQGVSSSAENFGPALISKKLLEILTPSDFEMDLYKSSTLLIILYFSDIESGFQN